ncbi:hypothetical protein Acy02nite_89990 [Actinoplanes cyaneus]|uniref:Uncharacterized protein n=1 Tax=Actinoplanes cyaneus TaxID=52696 RepID=A0A919ITH1_9ACTN|nr:hypothetical protein [Actinoplanes cyaneus]GID71118.1 hypothetical protein Acy02nite_89990 [Actinoplanes cyaneus]
MANGDPAKLAGDSSTRKSAIRRWFAAARRSVTSSRIAAVAQVGRLVWTVFEGLRGEGGPW